MEIITECQTIHSLLLLKPQCSFPPTPSIQPPSLATTCVGTPNWLVSTTVYDMPSNLTFIISFLNGLHIHGWCCYGWNAKFSAFTYLQMNKYITGQEPFILIQKKTFPLPQHLPPPWGVPLWSFILVWVYPLWSKTVYNHNNNTVTVQTIVWVIYVTQSITKLWKKFKKLDASFKNHDIFFSVTCFNTKINTA